MSPPKQRAVLLLIDAWMDVLEIAQPLSEIPRPLTPLDGRCDLVRQHVQLREVAVRHGQLAARRFGLQRRDRVQRDRASLRASTGPPLQPGDPPEVLSDAYPLAQLLPFAQRCSTRRQAGQGDAGQVCLNSVCFQQFRSRGRRQPIDVRLYGLIMRHSFPVCAERGGSGRGNRAVPQQCVDVVGAPGVVNQARRVGVRGLGQQHQRPPVQRRATGRRQRVLHRVAQQLMSVRDGVATGNQNARRDTFLHRRLEAGQNRDLGAGGHHRDQPGGLAGGTGKQSEPGQDEVAYGRRHGSVRRHDELRHQQRVAAGQVEQFSGVATGQCRLLGHAAARERRHRYGSHDITGQRGKDGAQRMIRAHLVIPVRHHEQRGESVDPATEEHQQVQCGRVGPVRVLHHDDAPRRPRRRPRKLLHQGLEELRGTRPGAHAFGQPSSGLSGDVVQGSRRPRRDERIAHAPQYPGPGSGRGGEGADQGRLADPSLAGDERHATRGGRLPQQPVEDSQRSGSFPQLHRPS